jgi:hypothetical protein
MPHALERSKLPASRHFRMAERAKPDLSHGLFEPAGRSATLKLNRFVTTISFRWGDGHGCRRRKETSAMASLGAVAVVLAGLAQDGAGPASAGCEMPAQGNGHVAAVLDARTLRLTDGRDVRLTGLARPAAPDAVATLTALTGDRDIVLRGADDGPDRYGRQGVFVFVEGSAQSVQAALRGGTAGRRGAGAGRP